MPLRSYNKGGDLYDFCSQRRRIYAGHPMKEMLGYLRPR